MNMKAHGGHVFHRGLSITAVGTACALAFGCAGVPAPNAEMAAGRTRIQDALIAGAAENAPAELKTARDNQERAEAALAAKDNAEARRLAEEAEMDARLAIAKA